MLDEHVSRMLKLNDNSPAPSAPDPGLAAPPGMVRCACNQKFIPLTDVQYYNTGMLQASDSSCRECSANVRGFAMIVCVKCRAVVSRIAPVDFPNGFRFEANKCYHTEACPTCTEGLEVSHVLEKQLYDKKRGPTKLIVNGNQI